MSRPRLEVADIIRSAGTDFIERNRSWLRWTHLKVLRGHRALSHRRSRRPYR